MSREYARLKELVAVGTAYQKTLADLVENRALLKTEAAESELAWLAKEEIARLDAGEKRLAQAVQFGLVPPDPTDSRNTIVEIRAGAGGSESAGRAWGCSASIRTRASMGCSATKKRA